MNLKLNNAEAEHPETENIQPVQHFSSAAEERRRNGRYISIVVGISLVCLAIYQAWIRQVPVLASLLVPALIMLLYIAWILYTASRDKHRALNLEAGGVLVLDPQIQGDERGKLETNTSKQEEGTTTALDSVARTNINKSVDVKVDVNQTPLDEGKDKVFKESHKEFRRCYSIA